MLQLNKDTIGLEIKDEYINIICGNKNHIKYDNSLKINSNWCNEGRILNEEEIINKINSCLKENKIKCNRVAYVIQGSDIVTRYIELPVMKEEALRESVYFEFGQFIKDLDLYYMDYEVIERVNLKDKKVIKILLVACPKNKIDSLVTLSNKLNLKLKDIDILSNCISRVIRHSNVFDKNVENVGVFYLGYKNSNFFIMEKGFLHVERFLPFGVFNILREVERKKFINFEEETAEFSEIIGCISLAQLFDEYPRIKDSIDNIIESTNKIIQFYTNGQSKRMVDKIIILSQFNMYHDVEEYINNAYETPCRIIKEEKELGIKIKNKNSDNFSILISTYGLFLRGK